MTLAAGRNFINNAGSGALSLTGGGRWLIYSTNPANDTLNGLAGDFRRYTCTYGGSCPSFPASGNGFLYSYTPLLTATPSVVNIIYGDAAPSLTGYGYTVSGYIGSDSTIDILTGSLNGSTAYTQGSDVGLYNINYTSGTLSSSLGYGFSYANNASGIAVGAKTLTAALINIVTKTYDGTTTATLNIADNYSLSGIFGTDDVQLGGNLTSGTYGSKNAGTGITISVSGLALTGAKASNYTLVSAALSADIGIIDKAPLTITADNQTITYGTTVPVATLAYTGFVAGEGPSNLISPPLITSVRSGIVDVGSYTDNYTVSGAASGDYAISYVSGDLTVQRRSLSVVVDNKSIFKGMVEPVFTGRNDLVAQDVSLITWAYAPKGYTGHSGMYVIEAFASDPLGRLANYIQTIHPGRYIVSQLPDTVMRNIQEPGHDLSDDGFSFTRFAFARRWGGLRSGRTNTSFSIEIDPALQQEFGFINPWEE